MTTTQTNQVCYNSPGIFNRAQYRGAELLTLQLFNDLFIIPLTFPQHIASTVLVYQHSDRGDP